MKLPRSRAEARKVGSKHYFTGKPCKNWHYSKRLTSVAACMACKLIDSLDWQRRKPDKANARNCRWRKNNKDQANGLIAVWKLKNPTKLIVYGQNRRARILSVGGAITDEDIKRIHKEQKYKCVYCGKSTRKHRHIDHVLPISLGGYNWPDNIQILCSDCNLRKGSLHPDEFAKRIADNDNYLKKKAA